MLGIILFAERIPANVGFEKPYKPVAYIFAVFGKSLRRCGSERRSPSVILRFVGEKSYQLFTEIILETFVILFVRFFYESIDDGGIQYVCIRGAHP